MRKNLTIETRRKQPVNFVDRTGLTYGRLTVLRYAGSDKNYRSLWECKCECGSLTIVKGLELNSGDTKSCGCLNSDRRAERQYRHGKAGTSIYRIWHNMMRRCTDAANARFNDYGGRGITVCERWQQFENFFADMGDRPKDRTLDRRHNDKGYWCGKCEECVRLNREPNCRWATAAEQNNNTRQNHLITYQGETLNITQWSKKTGLKPLTIYHRLKRGWSLEMTFLTPPLPRNYSKRDLMARKRDCLNKSAPSNPTP